MPRRDGCGSGLRARPPPARRARSDVATALLDGPADDRTLEEWRRDVGASSRTPDQAFAAAFGTFPQRDADTHRAA